MAAYDFRLIKFFSEEYNIYVDIVDDVILKMKSYINNDLNYESGGVLLGYKMRHGNSIIIEDLSEPHKDDYQSKFIFVRKSIAHLRKIRLGKDKRSFCIGNWHTHPFASIPTPSIIDLNTWKKEVKTCKSGFGFQIYIICGYDEFRVWIGNEKTNEIVELNECKRVDGLYDRG